MSTSLLERDVSQPSGKGTILPMAAHSVVVDAQVRWAAKPIALRLRILRKTRHLLASRTEALCAAIPSTLARNAADTYCSEIIPLLSASKFLEQEAGGDTQASQVGPQGPSAVACRNSQ